ncbi:MAG: HAD family phosphatase [Methyloprofundus sp.]|nr:HAD family phosphatase [Methyloprofundus sp.]MDT8424805.1 HAD family phosphatase [Methyloprofundus sp.]
MRRLPNFNALIFDMDGLVLDTEITYFNAWQQAASALGYQLSDEFCAGLSGLSFSTVELKLTQALGNDFPLAKFYPLSSTFWRATVNRNGIAVKKGLHDLLSVLKNKQIPYCLATNSPEKNARECLRYAGIEDLFALLVCRDHVQAPKPAPDIFLQAANSLGQEINSCLVVEDSLIGLLAAKNANAFSVLVPSMPVDEGMQQLAGIILNDLSELSVLVQGA